MRRWNRTTDKWPLIEATPSEVVGDDNIRHSIKNKLDVLCVSGARHVAVDLLGGALVLGLKLSLDVGCCLTILLCPCILVKTNCESRAQNFFLEKVLLVEEEDDRGVTKPFVVAD